MKTKHDKKKSVILVVLIVFLTAGIFGALLVSIYNGSLMAVVPNSDCEVTENIEACSMQSVVIEDGMNVAEIANALKERELIQNPFTFRIYSVINGYSDSFKAGKYNFNKTMSVQKITQKMLDGDTEENVFRIMTLPGGTLSDFKELLFENGYSEQEIDDALSAEYDFPFLASKPEGSSLEGYIFGETIEFETGDSAKSIVEAFLGEFQKAADEYGLEEKFATHGLSLHEGVILASIIQRESNSSDMKNVASVFYNRLASGMNLGSDVTVIYALDQIDPDRTTYTNNYDALQIDSCYNTRLYAGLPCGAISNPGINALLAVADPANTSYLYFLTGDDGLMYYGTTESEHQQNIDLYCQKLCNIQL